MKKFICIFAIVTLFAPIVHAGDTITVRLSYKVVLNPADGRRPPNVTDIDIDAAIAAMNALERSYSRGFRFQRVGAVINIGGRGDVNGPSRWYNTDFFDDKGAKDDMENEALHNQGLYAWNVNAVNIYITNFNGKCGGICSFPGDNDEIIIVAACADGDGATQLHEIGHYFNLFHTQGDVCECCDPDKTGKCHTTPGDDKVDDTLPDLACWARDGIANWTYKTNYAKLNDAQKKLVDDVFLNIMSYHGSNCGQGAITTRMTEGQLDRWTDAAKFYRMGVVDRQTWFVDPSLGGGFGGGGYSVFPFASLALAVYVAKRGDIVLIRPGALNEKITIDKQITLRATRQGPAVIGSPNTAYHSAAKTPEEIDAGLRQIPGIVSDRTHLRLDFAGANSGKQDQQ